MIQVDMPMPKNCLDCPACNEYLMCAIPVNGRGWGENDVKDFSQSRPEWCPLKEQPQIVRCKDCESFWQEEVVDHFTGEKKIAICCGKGNRLKSRDWFCADGERRTA